MDAQAIVIGTGFAGAVAALRLGEAGIRTIVLERGRRWDIADPTRNEPFTTFEQMDARAEWLNGSGRSITPAYDGKPIEKYVGVLEIQPAGELAFMIGSGVGGGSLAYGGILIEPPGHLFRQHYPDSVDYDEFINTYCQRVRSVIPSAPIPDDVLAADQFLGLRVFHEQARRAGFADVPTTMGTGDGICRFPMGVDWDVVRAELAGQKIPSYSAAEFWFGNNSGAKLSVDMNYMRQAEATGSIDLRTLHNVVSIGQETDGSYVVSYQRIDERGDVQESGTLSCQYLFLAAGTLGTCELLMRAGHRGALAHLDERLGQSFGDDGDTFVIRDELRERTNPHLGCPGCFALMHYDSPIAPCVAMRAPLPRFAQDYPNGDSLATFIFTHTDNRGRLIYNPTADSVTIEWPHDETAVEAARHLATRLCEANGGKVASISTQITGHQVGGASMGQVCDDAGRVKGHPNLFVIDGALLPGSSTCVNPALTIAALAERCMDRLLARDVQRA